MASNEPSSANRRAHSSSRPAVSSSMRGPSRETWPRLNALWTKRRNRVCFGGSLSRMESAWSQLKVSHTSSGRRGWKIRPRARSRSTWLEAAWLVATHMPSPSCHATGACALSSANAGYGSATTTGSDRSSSPAASTASTELMAPSLEAPHFSAREDISVDISDFGSRQVIACGEIGRRQPHTADWRP
jgi:hypothetical protein